MNLKRLFITDFQETQRILRQEFENEVEATLEEERSDSYAEGAMKFGEDIVLLTNARKESLRVEAVKDLELTEMKIRLLVEDFIERLAMFIVGFDAAMRIDFCWMILAILTKHYDLALLLFIVFLVMFVLSRIKGAFAGVSYAAIGGGRVIDDLLEKYNDYGRYEAALYFADYRRFSADSSKRNFWIFTTSHKRSLS